VDYGDGAWTTLSFIIGCLASITSSYIGMSVATSANFRCAFKARTEFQAAFRVAFQAGCVMGFALVSINLIIF